MIKPTESQVHALLEENPANCTALPCSRLQGWAAGADPLGLICLQKELGSIQGTWVGKGEGWEQLRVQKLEIWGWGCLGPALGPWSCLAPSPLGLCPNPAHDQPPQLAPRLRNPLNFL